MALNPLAEPEDVVARLGRAVTMEELARIGVLIEDASAAVRTYTGRTFGESETTTTMPLRNGSVVLPDDVSAIVSVETLDGNSVAYDWDGNRRLYAGAPWQFDIEPLSRTAAVVITYTRTDPVSEVGLATIKAVVCQMAARAFGRKADDSGMQQESIAGYSYTVGAAGAAGAVGMLPDERRALDRFRRVGGTAWLAVR